MPDTSHDAGAPYPLPYRNLMAVSLLGTLYRAQDAETASKAVENTLADPGRFRVYRAVLQSIGGEGRAAEAAMVAHLERHPDDDGAKLAVAMAKALTGDAAWKPLLENVLATSSDAGVREAATRMLGQLQRH